jgi:hypothetical protein
MIRAMLDAYETDEVRNVLILEQDAGALHEWPAPLTIDRRCRRLVGAAACRPPGRRGRCAEHARGGGRGEEANHLCAVQDQV